MSVPTTWARERPRDGAAAGPQFGDAQRLVGRHARQRGLDQGLGFRARNQHVRRDLQFQ
jgi:hypothetical protein